MKRDMHAWQGDRSVCELRKWKSVLARSLLITFMILYDGVMEEWSCQFLFFHCCCLFTPLNTTYEEKNSFNLFILFFLFHIKQPRHEKVNFRYDKRVKGNYWFFISPIKVSHCSRYKVMGVNKRIFYTHTHTHTYTVKLF